MTFTTVVPYDPDAAKENKVFIPLKRCRNKLLIVRPLKYQAEGFITSNHPEGTDTVFCDYALLDALAEAENEIGDKLPGFPAGTQFRNNATFARYLIGTFKRHIGETLLGTVHFGPATKGQPPIMWTDLTHDAASVARGQQWLAQHPEFLIPVEAQITSSAPAVPAGPAPGVATVAPQQAQVGVQVAGAPLSTLEQMRNAAQGQNPYQGEPPF